MENKVRWKRNTDRWEDDELLRVRERESDLTSYTPEGVWKNSEFITDNWINGFGFINRTLFGTLVSFL